MTKTQHQKILELCTDGQFHCQIEFWNLFIRSPHKRRGELEAEGHVFETRKCGHGVKNGFDYRLAARAKKTISQVVVIDGVAYERKVEVEV